MNLSEFAKIIPDSNRYAVYIKKLLANTKGFNLPQEVFSSSINLLCVCKTFQSQKRINVWGFESITLKIHEYCFLQHVWLIQPPELSVFSDLQHLLCVG